MYLISLYFDEITENIINKHIVKIAEKSGNRYMPEHKIPPHLTIASCEEMEQELLIKKLDSVICRQRQGKIEWVSTGSFHPHVLFLTPVLNEYLYEFCTSVNEELSAAASKYRPFAWLPHTTVARTMSDDQMIKGFRVLQANFRPFSGDVVRVGLAQSKPYHDIKIWELKE